MIRVHMPQLDNSMASPNINLICDWIWENSASMHSYEYLETLIEIIWSIITWEGKRCLHEICHDSIAIYDLSIH